MLIVFYRMIFMSSLLVVSVPAFAMLNFGRRAISAVPRAAVLVRVASYAKVADESPVTPETLLHPTYYFDWLCCADKFISTEKIISELKHTL